MDVFFEHLGFSQGAFGISMSLLLILETYSMRKSNTGDLCHIKSMALLVLVLQCGNDSSESSRSLFPNGNVSKRGAPKVLFLTRKQRFGAPLF